MARSPLTVTLLAPAPEAASSRPVPVTVLMPPVTVSDQLLSGFATWRMLPSSISTPPETTVLPGRITRPLPGRYGDWIVIEATLSENDAPEIVCGGFGAFESMKMIALRLGGLDGFQFEPTSQFVSVVPTQWNGVLPPEKTQPGVVGGSVTLLPRSKPLRPVTRSP